MKGDQLVIELSYGRFVYEIEKTKVVKKDDTSIVTLQHEKEELVLTTCYPFSFIGPAPNRYIIYGKRVYSLIQPAAAPSFSCHRADRPIRR